jgi:hypothetical protein
MLMCVTVRMCVYGGAFDRFAGVVRMEDLLLRLGPVIKVPQLAFLMVKEDTIQCHLVLCKARETLRRGAKYFGAN